MAGSRFAECGAAVLESIIAGASSAQAARRCGVGVRTVESWLEKGRRDPSGRYGPFAVAVDAARAGRELPPPDVLAAMDEDELALVVSESARRGNVQAMKLRWEQLRAAPQEQQVVTEAQKVMDELAERRRRHGRDG